MAFVKPKVVKQLGETATDVPLTHHLLEKISSGINAMHVAGLVFYLLLFEPESLLPLHAATTGTKPWELVFRVYDLHNNSLANPDTNKNAKETLKHIVRTLCDSKK